MSSQYLEYEGRTYCDWRLVISDCEGSQFFKTVNIFALSCDIFVISSFFICVVLRKHFFGDSWKSLGRGENLVLLLLIFLNMCYAAHPLTVLLGAQAPIPGIIWSFLAPPRMLSKVTSHNIVERAVPEAVLLREGSLWRFSDKTKGLLQAIFVIFFALSNVILISLGHVISAQGDPELGRALEKAGLIISSICIFFHCILFYISIITLKRKLEEVIKENSGMKEMTNNEIDNSLLLISLQKANQGLKATCFVDGLEITYFLLLAFYPRFFTLLSFSKAFASILLVVYPLVSVTYSLFQITVDAKRVLHARENKKSSSRGAKMDEISPENKLQSMIGKEGIEQLITDLKPKDLP